MKELEEIYQEMLDCFAQRTGLEAAESCDLAVRFYAVAGPGVRPVRPGGLGAPGSVFPRRRREAAWTATPSCGG